MATTKPTITTTSSVFMYAFAITGAAQTAASLSAASLLTALA